MGTIRVRVRVRIRVRVRVLALNHGHALEVVCVDVLEKSPQVRCLGAAIHVRCMSDPCQIHVRCVADVHPMHVRGPSDTGATS